jgi:Flp pilus assembly protein TadB
MANERTFAKQGVYERRPYDWQLSGSGLLRRRALELIVIGLAFVFMAGVNLDVFDATVGCMAVAAGGAWHWCLGLRRARRAGGPNVPSDAVVGRRQPYLEKKPATRRDPYFQ